MTNYLRAILATLIVTLISCEDQENIQSVLIDTVSIENHIKILASDEFQGRKPFTIGEEKTVEYLKKNFEKIGLKPGNNGSFFQEVPLVELTAYPSDILEIQKGEEKLELNVVEDFVAFTERTEEEVSLENSEVVFAGYGIVAPEYNWNDYEGLDVKGKTVIVLVNDPGFADNDTTFFKGKTMTYYGRWTYKYEEAARQGAAGVLIVHETVPAGYPWMVVSNGWSGASLNLDSKSSSYKPMIQGWITRDAAVKIFDFSEKDLKNYGEKSRDKSFKPVTLNVTASVSLRNDIKRDMSRNVVGMIEGSTKPEEVIIYSAHWDHIGVGAPVDGDSIYNGAHDNASGTACLLGIAEAFSKSERPERTVVFLLVTAEEQGLLGSKYYAENPIFDPVKTVANLNMDGVPYYGMMRDFTIVGYGQSELEDLAEEIAKTQNRYIKPDPEPGKGYFFRSDHFSFAKIGIPAIFASGTYEAVEGGVERIRELSTDYLSNKYHRPADEYNPEIWLFGGIYQDATLYFKMGEKLANSEIWPRWKEGSEFKSIRESNQ